MNKVYSHDSAPSSGATTTERKLTYGEMAVGLTFNPGGNETVNQIKQAFAKTIDILNDLREVAKRDSSKGEIVRMYSVAITEAQAAQMWAVKAITWSY